MPTKKNYSLKSWLLTRPALFSAFSFVTMTIASMIGGLIPGTHSATFAYAFTIIAFLGVAAWLIRSLPGANLNHRKFVAINTAQTLITSVVFIASMLYVMANIQRLMSKLFWMETHSNAYFLVLLIVLALFYLYLCGVYIGNLYAKYRRVRAMGVSMWKTLATAPFGFCMLWIPGYLMDDTKTSAQTDAPQGWYWRLIDWIIARPARTTGVLVVLILLAGFTLGYVAMILPLILAIVFAIWTAVIGTNKMRDNFSGIYSTIAIVINVVLIIGMIGYATIVRPHNNVPNNTHEIIQITDTIQQ